jgi:hypothetical protein
MPIAALKLDPICFQNVMIIRGLIPGGPSALRFLRLLKYSVELLLSLLLAY